MSCFCKDYSFQEPGNWIKSPFSFNAGINSSLISLYLVNINICYRKDFHRYLFSKPCFSVIFHKPAFPIMELLLHPSIKVSMCDTGNHVQSCGDLGILVNKLQSPREGTSLWQPALPHTPRILLPLKPHWILLSLTLCSLPSECSDHSSQVQVAHFLKILISWQETLRGRARASWLLQ